MSEEIKEREELLDETMEAQVVAENDVQEGITSEAENEADAKATAKPKLAKKKIAIIGGIAVVVIAIALIIFIPSKFERVKTECVHIAGMVTGSGDYFMIDTYPDEMYKNTDATLKAILLAGQQDKALDAIKYANEELGFSGAVYSQMLKTSALMGRQSEENDKYKVSWTYHPDEGLEVTYTKK